MVVWGLLVLILSVLKCVHVSIKFLTFSILLFINLLQASACLLLWWLYNDGTPC